MGHGVDLLAHLPFQPRVDGGGRAAQLALTIAFPETLSPLLKLIPISAFGTSRRERWFSNGDLGQVPLLRRFKVQKNGSIGACIVGNTPKSSESVLSTCISCRGEQQLFCLKEKQVSFLFIFVSKMRLEKQHARRLKNVY